MYKLCKTEQSAQRQRQLEDGLLQMMSLKRYEEISVSELCEYMQVPRKSFYRYFSSKDGALYALLDHTLMGYEGFTGAYRQGVARSLQKDLERFFLFWVRHKDLLDALQRSGMSGILIERSITHALSEMVIPKRFLPQDSEETVRHVTMFCVCGLMSMVLSWHHEGYRQTAEKMASIACRLLDKPLFPSAESFF